MVLLAAAAARAAGRRAVAVAGAGGEYVPDLWEIHPPMRGYSLIIPQGGHNFRTWDRELPPSLEWLSRRLS